MNKRPSNRELFDACMKRAWSDDVDDASRKLLEAAAKRIRSLHTRTISLAHSLELEEAVCQEALQERDDMVYAVRMCRQKTEANEGPKDTHGEGM